MQDSTTNPSLIYAASKLPQYSALVDDALARAKSEAGDKADAHATIEAAVDQLAVNFGREILKLVPGRVSTEIDARLSFDTGATVRRALAPSVLNYFCLLFSPDSSWELLVVGKMSISMQCYGGLA